MNNIPESNMEYKIENKTKESKSRISLKMYVIRQVICIVKLVYCLRWSHDLSEPIKMKQVRSVFSYIMKVNFTFYFYSKV